MRFGLITSAKPAALVFASTFQKRHGSVICIIATFRKFLFIPYAGFASRGKNEFQQALKEFFFKMYKYKIAANF